MNFVDEAHIEVFAGDGGNGCAAFRREAHTPRGGPCGGDGGNGGDVVVVADPQMSSLLDFRYQRHYRAKRGEDGRSKDQYGKGGEDTVLRVPVGTVVCDKETGAVLADMSIAHQRFVVAQGGKGGRGNIHFKSPWNQAPTQSEPGTKGEHRTLRLELKLLAEVGLIGMPSVGKSTVISMVSRARPKIAAYPFTTLIPNLGVAPLRGDRALVIADIPGLIPGASRGAGLGHRFLRHVERTRVLIHILDASPAGSASGDPISDFETINRELKEYAPELSEKPQLVALNKVDLTDTRQRAPEIAHDFAKRGMPFYQISAATGEGLEELLEATWKTVHANK